MKQIAEELTGGRMLVMISRRRHGDPSIAGEARGEGGGERPETGCWEILVWFPEGAAYDGMSKQGLVGIMEDVQGGFRMFVRRWCAKGRTTFRARYYCRSSS